MKWKILGRWILFVLLVLVLSVTFSFTVKERKQTNCEEIRVIFDDDKQFISASEIERVVLRKVPKLMGCLLDTLNTDRLETEIEKKAWVKNAEIFIGFGETAKSKYGGILNVHITQHEPVFRVQEGEGGFFVGTEHNVLPYSPNSASRLLVVTGKVNHQKVSDNLFSFIDYVNNDKFWSAQISQVHVRQNGELVLIPRVGNHRIEFGDPDHMELKFRNLKALYKQGFSESGWNKYSSISLKYSNQVICTLK